MQTLDFFADLKPPRAKRRVLMHVFDAGDGCCSDGEFKPIVIFECAKCGHQTDWMIVDSISEAKRGLPCPHCNV